MSKTLTKTLSLVLAIVMVLGLGAFNVLATDTTVNSQEELNSAVAAASEGDIISINTAGTYTLPAIPKNITIKGSVEGVVFSHTSAGNIASIPNGATFENIIFNFGNVDYHGFQHQGGTMMFNNCVLNGKFFGYGILEFNDCTFNAPENSYSLWTYGSHQSTFRNCTFNSPNQGQSVLCYTEQPEGTLIRTFENCTFTCTGTAEKSAVMINPTAYSNVNTYVVSFTGCTATGYGTNRIESVSGLVGLKTSEQVKDNITITIDNEQVYPVIPKVAQIGEAKYETLEEAFAAAQDGGTIKLLDNVTLSNPLVIDNDMALTLDLNGKKLDGQYVDLYNGFLSVKDTAQTKGSFDNLVYVNVGQDEAQAAGEYNRFTLDSTAVMNNNVYVYQNNTPKGYGSQVDISGTMNGLIFVLGNIHEGNSVVDVSGTISSPDDVAIALNGYATVNVSDGAVISANKDDEGTAIEVRAGTLNVTGGTMTGYGEPTSVTANGSGTTSTGAGIAVSQHTTKLPIAVNITGGTINGYSAFYESNPQNNSAEDLAKITLNIAGGTFNATQGGTAAVYSEDVTGFITNGTFSSNPNAYVKEGYAVVRNSNGTFGTFTVQKAEKTVSEITVDEDTGLTATSEVGVTEDQVTAAVNTVKEELANTAVTSTIDEVPADVATGINVTMKEIVVGKKTVGEGQTATDTKVKSITFDVTPFKTTGETKVDVHDLGQEITVVLPLPDNFDFGGVIRVIHNGKEVVKTGTLNTNAKTYTFKARFFSTYEITTRSQDYTVSVEQVNGSALNAAKIGNDVDKFYHSGDTVYEALIINNKTNNPLQGLSYELTYDSRYFDLPLAPENMNAAYGVSITQKGQAESDGTVTLTVETLSTANIPAGEKVLAVLPFTVKDKFGSDDHDPAPSDDRVYYVSITNNSIVSSGLSTEVAPSLMGDKITIKNFYKLTLENPTTLVTGDKGLTYPTSAVNGSNTAYSTSGTGPWYVKYDRASGANLVIENAGVGTYKYAYNVSFAGLKNPTTADAADGQGNTSSTVTIPWADVEDDITVTLTAPRNVYNVVVADGSEPLTIAANTATYGTDYSFTINDFDDALYDYKYTVTVGEKTIVNEVNADTALRTISGKDIKGAVTGKNLTINVTKTYDVKVAWKIDYVTGWTLVLVGAKHPTGFAYQYGTDDSARSNFFRDERYTVIGGSGQNALTVESGSDTWSETYTNIYAVLIDSSAEDFTLDKETVLANLKVTRATTEAANAYDALSGNTIKVNVDINNNGSMNYGDILAMYRAYQKYIRDVGDQPQAGTDSYNEFVYTYMDYYLRADADNNGKLDDTSDLSVVRDGADPYSISSTTNP